jgi:ATP-binding protein involved in chromosome partitioning
MAGLHLAVRQGKSMNMTQQSSPSDQLRATRTLAPAHAIAGVARVLAVSSGKGGVGKSTTAMNLALALADEGARVGLLDADIYGPSVPRMMGASGSPSSDDGRQTINPIWAHGIQLMSIGFLTDDDSPVVWRGAAASQMLEQLIRQTRWVDLDYLVIDMPPGTGDIPLTLCQRTPITGAVVVTTPQDVALLDVIKGVRMFQKADVPVLGAIENMAVHVCSQCGHESHPFGQGGGERLHEATGVPMLASMPLDMRVRVQADAGVPIVRSEPQGDLALRYRQLARALAAAMSQADAQAVKAPEVTVGLRIDVSDNT